MGWLNGCAYAWELSEYAFESWLMLNKFIFTKIIFWHG